MKGDAEEGFLSSSRPLFLSTGHRLHLLPQHVSRSGERGRNGTDDGPVQLPVSGREPFEGADVGVEAARLVHFGSPFPAVDEAVSQPDLMLAADEALQVFRREAAAVSSSGRAL